MFAFDLNRVFTPATWQNPYIDNTPDTGVLLSDVTLTADSRSNKIFNYLLDIGKLPSFIMEISVGKYNKYIIVHYDSSNSIKFDLGRGK